MNSVEEVRKYLLELYEKWAKEVEKIENGKFLGKDYSNPYYISIPDNWFDSDKRIMIVGEEGFGEWGAGKQYGWKKDEPSWKFNDFEKIINYNRIKILKQVDELKLTAEEINLCNKTNNKFWIRFSKIYKLGLPCVWNNLDKIHVRDKNNCALLKGDREQLHGLDAKILAKEIEILKPTIVLFCGWSERKDVFKKELPEEVFDAFYKNCKKHKIEEYKIYVKELNNICYILSYHPSYSTNRIKGYEEAILETIKKQINY